MSEMHSDQPAHFLCDQNLGRLAKWLRMLGFDADYMSLWDEKQVRQAITEGRMVLTRKTSLARQVGVMVVSHDHVSEQLQEIGRIIALKAHVKPFTRCNLCNKTLIPLSREMAKEFVPEYVFSTQETFSSCPSCGRIYWKGTHFSRAYDMMESLLKDL